MSAFGGKADINTPNVRLDALVLILCRIKLVGGLSGQHLPTSGLGVSLNLLQRLVPGDRHYFVIGSLARFTGEYDVDGNQAWTKGKLRFESVYRFKGQQAPAVVLVNVDPSKEEAQLERDQRVLFCGMTRATVRLDLVMKEDNPINRKMSN